MGLVVSLMETFWCCHAYSENIAFFQNKKKTTTKKKKGENWPKNRVSRVSGDTTFFLFSLVLRYDNILPCLVRLPIHGMWWCRNSRGGGYSRSKAVRIGSTG